LNQKSNNKNLFINLKFYYINKILTIKKFENFYVNWKANF
jgi:hypothetical protein